MGKKRLTDEERRAHQREHDRRYRQRPEARAAKSRYQQSPEGREVARRSRLRYLAKPGIRERNRAYARNQYKKPEILKRRRSTLLKQYKISLEDYTAFLAKQGGVYAICRKPETMRNGSHGRIQALSVDHDHVTDQLRGLLCNRCNTLVGKVEDQSGLLRQAAEYLERFMAAVTSR